MGSSDSSFPRSLVPLPHSPGPCALPEPSGLSYSLSHPIPFHSQSHIPIQCPLPKPCRRRLYANIPSSQSGLPPSPPPEVRPLTPSQVSFSFSSYPNIHARAQRPLSPAPRWLISLPHRFADSSSFSVFQALLPTLAWVLYIASNASPPTIPNEHQFQWISSGTRRTAAVFHPRHATSPPESTKSTISEERQQPGVDEPPDVPATTGSGHEPSTAVEWSRHVRHVPTTARPVIKSSNASSDARWQRHASKHRGRHEWG